MRSSAYSAGSRDSRNHLLPPLSSSRHEPYHRQRHHHHRTRRTPSISIRSAASAATEGGRQSSDQEGLIHVLPGDTLQHGRYKVLGIAGQGTFGTVLDVFDTKHHQRLALKVVRSVSRYLDAAAIEIDILDKIRRADTHKQSSARSSSSSSTATACTAATAAQLTLSLALCLAVSLCVRLYSDFELHHNGQLHVCIGTEKLGRSLYEFIKKNRYRGFQLRHVRHFAYQLIAAVAFCHSIGLIHTDLKPENILLARSHYCTVQQGQKDDYRVPTSTEIRLIDFGGATFDTEHHSRIVNTRQYRAPEVLLGLGWSFPSDLWSVGCILCELLTGELLFPTHEDLEHLAMMEKVLEEELPADMTERAIRPWRQRRDEERDRRHKERERERSRERRRVASSSRNGRRGAAAADRNSNDKRARSPQRRDDSNKRRRHSAADGDEQQSRRPRSASSSFSPSRHHHQHGDHHRHASPLSASPALSPSVSRDRSSSHARVNHLLSLNTGRLRWPPAHASSASSVKHVKRAPTLRSLLLPADPSGDMYDLVRRCLCYDPSRRITAEEALRHRWLRGVKEELEAERREERERDREKERGRERRDREEEQKGDRDRDGGGGPGGSERREASDSAAFSVRIDYAEEKRRDDRAARDDSERDRRKHAEAGGSSSRTSGRRDVHR